MTWPMRKKLGFLSPRRVVFRYLGECTIIISTVNKNIIMCLFCRNQGKLVTGTTLQVKLTKFWKDLFGRLWHLWRHETRLQFCQGLFRRDWSCCEAEDKTGWPWSFFSYFLGLFISCFHKLNQFSVWQHKSIWFTSYHLPGTGYAHTKKNVEMKLHKFVLLINCSSDLSLLQNSASGALYTSIFFLPTATISYMQLLLLSDLWWK